MVLEARRIGLRFVWAFIAVGFAIAISVAFPLFLIAREVRLASNAPRPIVSPLVRTLDYAGLALVGALVAALAIWLH